MIEDARLVRPSKDVVVLELQGEHDLSTRDATRELLERLVEGNELVVVDLSQTLFIDSSLLHSLAAAHRLAQGRGTRVRLQLGAVPGVRTALEISGLLDHLECFDDREQAIAAP